MATSPIVLDGDKVRMKNGQAVQCDSCDAAPIVYCDRPCCDGVWENGWKIPETLYADIGVTVFWSEFDEETGSPVTLYSENQITMEMNWRCFNQYFPGVGSWGVGVGFGLLPWTAEACDEAIEYNSMALKGFWVGESSCNGSKIYGVLRPSGYAFAGQCCTWQFTLWRWSYHDFPNSVDPAEAGGCKELPISFEDFLRIGQATSLPGPYYDFWRAVYSGEIYLANLVMGHVATDTCGCNPFFLSSPYQSTDPDSLFGTWLSICDCGIIGSGGTTVAFDLVVTE